jgi:SPP1 gp7 family putative phage head morphogenesis protein
MLYNKKYFENDGTPNNIFSTPQSLSKTQRQQLTDVLYNYQKGVNKSHRTLVMDSDVKWMGARTSNKDMEFLSGRKFTIDECAMVFGVPKETLQIYEDINYATSVTANRSLWEKTLIPEMRLIAETINNQLLSKLGYRCEFNTKGITALAQPLAELADAATKFWNMGVTFRDINERFGFGFNEFDGWDKPFSGTRDFIEPITEPIKSKYYISQEDQLNGIRKAQWTEIIDKTNPFVGTMSKKLRGYFRSVNQKLMKRLADSKSVVKQIDDIEVIIAGLTDDEKLKSVIAETERDAILAGAKTVAELNAAEVELMLAKRLTMVTEINNTTNTLLKEALRKTLEESVKAGLTEAETVKALIDSAESVNVHNLKRARTIARTEVHGAFSESRHEAVKDLEPKTKTWLSDIYGDKTRDSHKALNGKTIKYNERFPNGLLYPLDSSGSPEEVINCRCVLTYGFE